MPSKYDENTKAKAVRLVREHRDDYETEWTARWTMARPRACRPRHHASCGRNRELAATIEILNAATTFFARGATRNTVDLRIH
jgi:transposase